MKAVAMLAGITLVAIPCAAQNFNPPPGGARGTCSALAIDAPAGNFMRVAVHAPVPVETVGSVRLWIAPPECDGCLAIRVYEFVYPAGVRIQGPTRCTGFTRDGVTGTVFWDLGWAGPADFNCDNDPATDQDLQDFFACLGGACCPTCAADFDGDGEIGTDSDIEAFFRALGGGAC